MVSDCVEGGVGIKVLLYVIDGSVEAIEGEAWLEEAGEPQGVGGCIKGIPGLAVGGISDLPLSAEGKGGDVLLGSSDSCLEGISLCHMGVGLSLDCLSQSYEALELPGCMVRCWRASTRGSVSRTGMVMYLGHSWWGHVDIVGVVVVGGRVCWWFKRCRRRGDLVAVERLLGHVGYWQVSRVYIGIGT